MKRLIGLALLFFLFYACKERIPEEADVAYRVLIPVENCPVLQEMEVFLTESGLNVAVMAERVAASEFLDEFTNNMDIYDLVLLPDEWLARFVDEGWIVPLHDKLSENETDYYSEVWDRFSVDGLMYALPLGWTSTVLYYNRDLFNNKGLDFPQEEWTWDDLLETAEILSADTNDDATNEGNAIAFAPDFPILYSFIRQKDGQFYNSREAWIFYLRKEFYLVSEALQYLSDLIYEDGVARPLADEKRSPEEIFLEGNTGMLIGDRSYYPALQTAEFDWSYQSLPHMEQRAVAAHAIGWGMVAASSNEILLPEAMESLNACYQQELLGQSGYWISAQIIPAESTINSEAFGYDNETDPFIAQLDYAEWAPQVEEWPLVYQALSESVMPLFYSNAPATNGCELFRDRADALMKD